jgi:hypothetical protein
LTAIPAGFTAKYAIARLRVNIKLETRDIPPLDHLIDDLRDGTRLIQVTRETVLSYETTTDDG